MTLVVDASVAVKFLVREVKTDEARQLLVTPEPLIAPDWLLVEAASTFWKKVKRSELLMVHAERHLADLPLFFARLYPAVSVIERALALSFRLRHSVYDCVYYALAEREGVTFVTADEKFVEVLREANLARNVRLL